MAERKAIWMKHQMREVNVNIDEYQEDANENKEERQAKDSIQLF